jgi:hypothetical protein
VAATSASVKPSPPSTMGARGMRAVGMARCPPAAIAAATSAGDYSRLGSGRASPRTSGKGQALQHTVGVFHCALKFVSRKLIVQ